MTIRGVAEMTEPFSSRVVVPAATRDDAAVTATTLRSYFAMDATVIAVQVTEKASGELGKASVEQHEQRAAELFPIITERFDNSGVALGTDLHYGTNIASSIVGTAHDRSTSAIAFTSRDKSRWHKPVTGDSIYNLVRRSDVPMLTLPDREGHEVQILT